VSQLYETLEEALYRRRGVETVKVNLLKLQKSFDEFHEKYQYDDEEPFEGEALEDFTKLITQLMYEGHYFKYDPRTDTWYGERVTKEGPWEEVELNKFFFFFGPQTI
jgi:hypothetical protein